MKFEGIEVRPVPGDTMRFVRGDGDCFLSGGADGEAVTLVTQPLYDAIPKCEISLDGLPDIEDLYEAIFSHQDGRDTDFYREFISEKGETGTIYFILSIEHGLIKIGLSRNMSQRRYNYKTANPGTLEEYIIPGNRSVERAILMRFKKVRHHGEWHYPHPTLIAYIHGAI